MYKSDKASAYQVIFLLVILSIGFRIYFWNGLLSMLVLTLNDTILSFFTAYIFYFFIEKRLNIDSIWKWLFLPILIFASYWIMKYVHFFSYLFTGSLTDDFLKEFNTSQFQVVDNLLVLIIGFLCTYAYLKYVELDNLSIEYHKLNDNLTALKVLQLKQEFYPNYLLNSIDLVYFSIDKNNTVGRSMLTTFTDLLRYQFDGVEKERISYFTELDFIEKYLYLYSSRAKDKYIVQSDLNYPDRDFLIPPMLFIPFIENAFKHGGNINQERCLIDITLHIKDEEIKFHIKNTKGLSGNRSATSEKGGIIKTKKRLEIIYGKNFNLQIVDEEFVYRLNLTLPKKIT